MPCKTLEMPSKLCVHVAVHVCVYIRVCTFTHLCGNSVKASASGFTRQFYEAVPWRLNTSVIGQQGGG